MKKSIIISLFCLIISYSVNAHEGHSHGEHSEPALHGGTVHALKKNKIEVVLEGDTVKLYLSNPADVTNLKVMQNKKKLTATVEKNEALINTIKIENIKPGRFSVESVITTNGTKEKAKFNLEKAQ